MRFFKARKLTAALITLALILGMAPAFAAGDATIVADSVYRNGNIYTVDEKNTTASALAVVGDKLVYVGDEAGVEAFIGPATKVTDLGGKTVLPGFIEGHMHIFNLGKSMLIIDAFWKPKQVILDAVAAEVAKAQPGEWIQGRGWMNTVWEDDSYPTKEDLDAVAPNNPVYIVRADGHMAWVNSKAFELAGVTAKTPDPQGGEYLKNDKGELQGCMTDTAMTPINKLIPAWSAEKEQEAVLLAQKQLFSYGFTSALDAGTSVSMLNHFESLYEKGDLKVRLYPLISIGSTTSAEAEYVKTTPIVDGMYNNRLNVKGVKIVSDGSLGARSAAMLEEYSDRAGHTGNLRFTEQELYDVVKMSYDSGYQTGVHAIGDGANHQILDVYERVLKENPREDPRLRIEHFQILTMDDITRAIKMGILPAMQQTHATSDMLMAEDRIGAERMKGAYAWRTVIDQGSIIIGGSDAAVELLNPFHGLYAGVTRKSRAGDPDGGWYPEQKMTREENLKTYTIWAAYGQFAEALQGSLEVGKLADFQVIDRDYMTCPENDIKDIQTLMTVCGGEVVYTKDTAQPTIMWNGIPITFTDKIVLENGTTLANVASMTSNMGAEFKDKDAATVTVTLSGKGVDLPITKVDGKIYVPVRAMFEGLGYTVNWYQDSRCISTSR